MSRFSLLRSGRQAPASGKARSDYVGDDDFVAEASAGRSGRQKEAPDPALPEKKRARRRLVGAITLTLMAVIVLPLVFDPEPKPISQDVAIDVSTRSKPAMAVAAEPAPAQQNKPPQTAEPAQQPSAAPVAAAAALAGTAAVATATVKPAAKPAEAAPPAPKAEAKPAANAQGKLIIQVAALATQQKAADLQAKLKAAGISSHTQKVDTGGGQRIRVRVGPLASKKDVDATCAKLGKMKLQCTLVPA